MRTIDADAVAKHLWEDDEYQNCSVDYNEGIKDAIKAINNSPTVDPVKHGRWKMYKTFYACSVCEYPDMGHMYDYCPNCGAKMDGEI